MGENQLAVVGDFLTSLDIPVEDDSDKTHRSLRGLEGLYYATRVRGENVVLIEESLSVTTGGTWKAWGVVPNEKTEDIGNIVVTAALFAKDGTVIEKASGQVPIHRIPAGEPAPFVIHTLVRVAEVDRIGWTVTLGAADPLDILVYGSSPMEEPSIRDLTETTLPGYGNLGERVKSTTLVIAWL